MLLSFSSYPNSNINTPQGLSGNKFFVLTNLWKNLNAIIQKSDKGISICRENDCLNKMENLLSILKIEWRALKFCRQPKKSSCQCLEKPCLVWLFIFLRRQENLWNQMGLGQILYYKFARFCQYLTHCVKKAQIRSYFWSVFSCIRTEYGDLLRISTLFTQCFILPLKSIILQIITLTV